MNEMPSPGSGSKGRLVLPTRGGLGCSSLTPAVRVTRTRRHKVRRRSAAADRGALWVIRHSR